MASTTTDTDTELSAVNAILGAIGQSPVTTLGTVSTGTSTYDNPEVAFIYNLLRDSNVDIQAEGWHFNTEDHVTYTPDAITKKIPIGDDILKMDVHDGWSKKNFDVVRRSGYLYDKYDHTDEWDDDIDLDIVRLLTFDDLPPVFKRYIVYRASRMAATQLVSNPDLVQLLTTQESLARAACMEYECNQGNATMFGFPEDTIYQTYQPWRNLRR
tara:strand:+ start:161 stop:799 length:639 start_codon:yes stop_codon:yes gene_type:complete